MGKIIIFGDSITRGAFDLERGGWTSRLKMFFWQRNYENTGVYYEGINIHYFGIGGDTVSDVISRFDCEIETIRGEIDQIIFAVGINDAGFNDDKKINNKKKFEKDLNKLVEKGGKKAGKENIYFVGITNVNVAIAGDWFEEIRLREFDEIIQKVTKNSGCNFISMYGILAKDDFCSDGLHPNAQGHEKMFECIKEFLIEENIV